jgi:hypothetical protein
MILDEFISATLARYLFGCPPLKIWEQAAIIYQTKRPIVRKMVAYEELACSPNIDDYAAWFLRRIMRKAAYWLNAAARGPSQGCFFVANSLIEMIPPTKMCNEYSKDTGYFSTYRKAKAFLDKERWEAQSSEEETVCYQSIADWQIDRKYPIIIYHFDNEGYLIDVYEHNRYNKFNFGHFPENRFVDLGDPFEYGDIVTWRSPYYSDNEKTTQYGVCYSSPEPTMEHRISNLKKRYAESPDIYLKSKISSPFKFQDFSDICTTVFYLHEDGKLNYHEHIPTWELDRFEGELPEEQALLREISLHMKGVNILSSEELSARGLFAEKLETILDFDNYPHRNFSKGLL